MRQEEGAMRDVVGLLVALAGIGGWGLVALLFGVAG